MKRRFIVPILVISLCLGSLTGCGKGPANPTAVPTDIVKNTETPSNTPTEAAKPTSAEVENPMPTTETVAPTEVPVEPTEVPAAPTEVPVEPTEVPAVPTDEPVEPTEVPVVPTDEPVEPTEVPVTPTEQPEETPAPVVTDVPEETPAPTATEGPKETPAPTVTEGAKETPVPTDVPEPTATNIPEPTDTPVPTNTNTPTPKPTNTNTPTPKPTNTNTPSPKPTNTNTPSPKPTNTNTPTPKPTKTPTPKPTNTPTPKPTNTNTPSPKPTNTNTPSPKPTNTNTPSPKPTNTNTPTPVPTNTNTPKPTATNTPKPTKIPGATQTPMPTKTPAQKVKYTDKGVDTSKIEWNCGNHLYTQDEIISQTVGNLYSLGGKSGSYGSSFFSESKEYIMEVAEKIAALRGIEYVEVEEYYRYRNGSVYMLRARAFTSFRYFYALDTGDTSRLDDKDKAAIAVIKDLVEQSKAYKTDFEKEKFFHDYLVSTIEYNACDSFGDGQTPYGALILKQCVCNGYASSFELLMNLAGITCTYVIGLGNGGSHAWNQVLMGGAWYNVDVTWDDPVPDDPGRVRYDYLNVNDEAFSRSHKAESDFVATCFATEYNAMKMMYTECKNLAEVDAFIKSNLDKGITYMEFFYTGTEELEISELSSMKGHGYSMGWSSSSIGDLYKLTVY